MVNLLFDTPNNFLLMNRKNLIWLTTFFVFFSTFFYVPPAYSDLGRYYELIESLSQYNFYYAVAYQQEQDIDFIYTMVMLGAHNLGISLHLVTAIVCSSFWFIISKTFAEYLKKFNSFVLLCFLGVVCFPNMMYVISIARNVMAFVFLFIGFKYWLNNLKIRSSVFFILSVFTHFSCLIHIFLFLCSFFAYKYWLVKHPICTSISCVILPLITYFSGKTLINDFFLSSVMQDLFGDSAGYGSYVSREVHEITYSFVGIGEIAYLLSHLFIVYVLIILDRKNSLEKVMVMVFFSMITMAYGCSYNLLVRFFLCFTFFYSLYISESIIDLKKGTTLRFFLTIGSGLSILVFAWNYHGLIMKYWVS